MTQKRTVAGFGVLALAVILAGCGSSDTAESAPDGAAASSDAPVTQLDVRDTFGRATWSVEYSNDADVDPLVLPDQVVVLNGDTVESSGTDGKSRWAAPLDLFTAEDRVTGGDGDAPRMPALRQVSDDVVALVDAGKAAGEGLDEDTYVTRVHLISLSDGTVNTVAIPGTHTNSADLMAYGLAFEAAGGDDAPVVVHPDGSTEDVEGLQGTLGGTHVLGAPDFAPSTSNGMGGSSKVGYTIGGWDTVTDAPLADYTGVRIDAYSDSQVFITWVNSRTGPGGIESTSQLIDVATGDVIADDLDECGPPISSPFIESPNGEHAVAGALSTSASSAQCVGGEGQKTVTLQAVADDGTTYGKAGDTAVLVTPDGQVQTAEGVGDADLLGIMNGDIAVHEDDGVLTGNPVK